MEQKKLKPAPSIFHIMAKKYHLDPDRFLQTIKSTIMRQGKDKRDATMEEIAALLIVANRYGLDPFTNEIYGFPSKKGGIVPIVGIDGHVSIMNRHKDFDGMDTPTYSEDIITMEGAKPCPEWCEITLYRKNFKKPIVVREYLDEVYRKGDFVGPWQTHTKRMLRHKTIIQAARIGFGITGIYDPDEAQRIMEAEVIETTARKPNVEIPTGISEHPEKKAQEKAQESQQPAKLANAGQITALHTIAKHLGKDGEQELHQFIGDEYGANSVKDLSFKQAQEAIDTLTKRTRRNG